MDKNQKIILMIFLIAIIYFAFAFRNFLQFIVSIDFIECYNTEKCRNFLLKYKK